MPCGTSPCCYQRKSYQNHPFLKRHDQKKKLWSIKETLKKLKETLNKPLNKTLKQALKQTPKKEQNKNFNNEKVSSNKNKDK